MVLIIYVLIIYVAYKIDSAVLVHWSVNGVVFVYNRQHNRRKMIIFLTDYYEKTNLPEKQCKVLNNVYNFVIHSNLISALIK